MGWVLRRRDHGGVIFVDLRDREGITQVVFNPEVDQAVHAKAHEIRNEYVLAVRGNVDPRPEGMVNSNLKTGEIEVMVTELKILNPAITPAFGIEDDIDVSELTRLKFRHLDLRRPQMQKNLILRHRATTSVRSYLNGQGRRPGLPGAQPGQSRSVLCAASVASVIQAAFYDRRLRPVLPDRALLPG